MMSPMSKDEPISSRVDTIAVYGSSTYSTKAYEAVLLIHYLDIVNLIIIIHHLFYINDFKSVYQQIHHGIFDT